MAEWPGASHRIPGIQDRWRPGNLVRATRLNVATGQAFELPPPSDPDVSFSWVILRTANPSDGFGLGDEVSGFRTFRVDAYCRTYYCMVLCTYCWITSWRRGNVSLLTSPSLTTLHRRFERVGSYRYLSRKVQR